MVWKVSRALARLERMEERDANYSDLERRIIAIERWLTELGAGGSGGVFATLCSLLRGARGADGAASVDHAGMGKEALQMTDKI